MNFFSVCYVLNYGELLLGLFIGFIEELIVVAWHMKGDFEIKDVTVFNRIKENEILISM